MSASVLVVDDDRAITVVLSQILASEGFSVETAFDGRAALEKLAARRFDVVITDVRMPGLDGPGLYKALAERWPEMTARVIFISGDAYGGDPRLALAGASVPMLHKPFDIGDLRRAVQDALAR